MLTASNSIKGINMKKITSLLSVLALGACVYGTPVNNEGFYTEMDLSNVDWSQVNRKGYTCQTNWFFIIPFGDNSVPTAIKSAKVKKVAYIDTDYALYFPLFSRECTNVWGMGDVTMDLPDIPDSKPAKSKKSSKSEKAEEKVETPAKAETTEKATETKNAKK